MEEIEDENHRLCPACDSVAHNPEKVGERIHLYTKTALACRPHGTLEELADSCEAFADKVRDLEKEGSEVVQASPDGHIYLERMMESEVEHADLVD